jgi:hypothetical protein
MGSQRSELQSFLTNLSFFLFRVCKGRGIFLLHKIYSSIPSVLSRLCRISTHFITTKLVNENNIKLTKKYKMEKSRSISSSPQDAGKKT